MAPQAARRGRSETEQPNGSRREDILVAAARLFADVGYENTTDHRYRPGSRA